MKKLLFVIFSLLCLFPIKILAEGDILIDKDNLKILKGTTESFNINLNNAAGRINILSNNTDIASVDTNSVFLDMNMAKITVTGNNVGNTFIAVYAYDVSTYDMEVLDGITRNINVTVYEKGDSNYDGKIDLIDVISLLKKYLGVDNSNNDINVIDINNDNDFNLLDVIILLRKYLGIE